MDFTLSFRNLPDLYNGVSNFYPKTRELEEFLQEWKACHPTIDNLNSVNPLYIPRNHQVEKAIRSAYAGDYELFKELVEVSKDPFTRNESYEKFKQMTCLKIH